jgi:hypothetical protein
MGRYRRFFGTFWKLFNGLGLGGLAIVLLLSCNWAFS